MIVVDTSVWIGYFRKHDLPQVKALRAMTASDVLLGDIVLLEILQGLDSDSVASRAEMELRQFTGARMLGPETAVEAARNYRALRRLGITVRSTADTIVATYCVRHNHQLLHADRDFDAFERHLGLTVYRPEAP